MGEQHTDLLSLADRVEKAEAGSLELDAEIACAIFKTIKTDDDLIYRVPVRKCDDCAAGTYWHVQRSGRSLHTAPLYTGSTDAAMSLIPQKWIPTLDRYIVSDKPHEKTWRVWLKLLAGDVAGDGPCCIVKKFATGATPAITICAAALRAIASKEKLNG